MAVSYLKVGNESMSAIRFHNTLKGDLPHLYYTVHTPEPLGTEFKTVACSITGALLFTEIQCGKEGVKNNKYHLDHGEITACTKSII